MAAIGRLGAGACDAIVGTVRWGSLSRLIHAKLRQLFRVQRPSNPMTGSDDPIVSARRSSFHDA